MRNVIDDLYDVVLERKANPPGGSYTAYLFEQGLDKILKKCGEESAEMLIAAKNGNREELANEISDLLYHILVLMCETGLALDEVYAILEERRQKTGNLKAMRQTDKNS
ncbi:MAG: phosphoribosyl-ATP diphosphatase [Peptococcaceae bacterium]|jgi:phosphoribosyl-ATP pyrophosphohydrolase|nr:phosphoribosyl-ATP diphosphatase [Peptococcaceae bacterium]